MNKGQKMSKKDREHLSRVTKGHIISDETKAKISKTLSGRKWAKKEREAHMRAVTPEFRKRQGDFLRPMRGSRGYKWSEEQKEKLSKALKGNIIKKSTRRLISEKLKGKNHYNWKGGVTPENQIIRRSLKYRKWRTAVFKRDKYTCTLCGDKGYVQAHHRKPFSEYPELRFDVNNGQTLCKKCHADVDKHYRRFYLKAQCTTYLRD